MSTDYYLVCKEHEVGINLTDNKLNPPIDEDMLKLFFYQHIHCHPIVEDEHEFDYEIQKKFKKWAVDLKMDIYKGIQAAQHGVQRTAFGSMVRSLARKIILLGWWLAEHGSR